MPDLICFRQSEGYSPYIGKNLRTRVLAYLRTCLCDVKNPWFDRILLPSKNSDEFGGADENWEKKSNSKHSGKKRNFSKVPAKVTNPAVLVSLQFVTFCPEPELLKMIFFFPIAKS